MRELSDLVLTMDDIHKCANGTKHQDGASNDDQETTYTRVRATASNVIEHGSDKFFKAVRRMRYSSRLQDSRLPLQTQVMRNLAKLEKRHDNLKQKRAEADVIDLSEFEQRLSNLVMERSRLAGLPLEKPCLEDHVLLGEKLCDQCGVWHEYYKEINRVIDMVEVRNSWVFTRYNPLTSVKTSIDAESPRSHQWTEDNLHPVGLFIEPKALEWMIQNKMNPLLQNVLGNIIVTKW